VGVPSYTQVLLARNVLADTRQSLVHQIAFEEDGCRRRGGFCSDVRQRLRHIKRDN